MYNAYSRFRFLSILLVVWLAGVDLWGTAGAAVTGNASLLYNLIEEDGEWSGEFQRSVNMGMRFNTGGTRLLGINLGFIWRGEKFDLLTGLTPTYSINLQGRNYELTSGYSVGIHRNITTSRLYETLRLSLPSLPVFRLTYAKHGMKDTKEDHKINTSGNNIQFALEDEVGPFRVRLDRRTYTSRDLLKEPEYDVTSTNTSGDVDFAYSYRRLLSLNGRYGLGELHIDREATGRIESEKQDFSLGFRLSPIRAVALSGTTTGRKEQRKGNATQASAIQNDSLTNRLQLMLQPLIGVRLNAAYSRSDTDRNENRPFINESRSLAVNIEPREDLALSGQFTAYDSQKQGKPLSTLRRDSFGVRVEPIEHLLISSRLSLSRTTNFATGLHSDRKNVLTRLEAIPTRNLRTNISYDWQRSAKELADIIDRDTQHRLTLDVDYSFARMLNVNFRSSRSISSAWEGSTTLSTFGLRYLVDESHISLRYNRATNPGRSSALVQVRRRTTQSFTVDFGQRIGRDLDLSLGYESRLSGRESGHRGSRRVSFRVNVRF